MTTTYRVRNYDIHNVVIERKFESKAIASPKNPDPGWAWVGYYGTYDQLTAGIMRLVFLGSTTFEFDAESYLKYMDKFEKKIDEVVKQLADNGTFNL